MTKCTVTSVSFRTSFVPVVVGILFCHFLVLFEEPDIIPDNNRMFFNESLDKAFYFSKKDENLEKVLKVAGPPLTFGHIMNVLQGHLTEKMVMLKENNSEYTLISKYPFGEKVIKFQIGKEFEEISLGGEKLQSVVIQDTDKLIHIQRRPFKRPTVLTTRWFSPDRLVVVIEIPKRNLSSRIVFRPAAQQDSRYQEVPRHGPT